MWKISVGLNSLVLLWVPDNEVWVSFLHNEFFWADVLLLSGVYNMALLQDLHSKCLVLITLQLHLELQNKKKKIVLVFGCIHILKCCAGCYHTQNLKIFSSMSTSAMLFKFKDIFFLFTNSTRPNPPTPSVSMMLKSDRCRLKKNAFSASYLHDTKQRNGKCLAEFIRNGKILEHFSFFPFCLTSAFDLVQLKCKVCFFNPLSWQSSLRWHCIHLVCGIYRRKLAWCYKECPHYMFV